MSATARSVLLTGITCLLLGVLVGRYVGDRAAPPAPPSSAGAPVNEAGAADYTAHLELFDVSTYRTTAPMGPVVAVQLKIRNGGDRVVTRLDVTLQFLDGRNAVIHTSRVTPIRQSPLPAGAFDVVTRATLRPQHLYEMRGGYFAFENVPDTWQAGNVVAEIAFVELD